MGTPVADVRIFLSAFSSPNAFKLTEFDAFVANLDQEAKLRIIPVTPAPIKKRDLQSGLVFVKVSSGMEPWSKKRLDVPK